jgi:hypothetical protein
MPPLRRVDTAKHAIVQALDRFHHRLDRHERDLRQFKGQPTTVPIYDPDFPDDGVAGQVALATEPPPNDGPPTMFPYYRDPVGWHGLLGSDSTWAYGQANLHTTNTNADYFTTSVLDPAVYDYDAATKHWHIRQPGSYLAFHRGQLQDSGVDLATRIYMFGIYESAVSGHISAGVLYDGIKPGTLDLAGDAHTWNLNEVDLLSIDPSQLPLTIRVRALASDEGDHLLALQTTLLRVSTRWLLNPDAF